MANQNSNLKTEVGLDSRRMASGTLCEIIGDRVMIGFITRYGLLPEGVVIDPTTGCDAAVPAVLAIPFYMVPELKKLSSEASNIESIINNSKIKLDDIQKIRAAEAVRFRFKEFLKKNMILVYINFLDPAITGPRYGINLNGRQIMVDTTEVSPAEGRLVDKNVQTKNAPYKWTDKVK